jgi:hypothetical protein
MDTTALRDAYRALLDAASALAEASGTTPAPPAGEWSAEQVLAHVALVNAATITAASSVASAAVTTYDNRIASDAWTIDRVIALAGGNAGLRDRIRAQGDALCALVGAALSETEVDTLVPTLLLSNGTVLVDQPLPLRDIIAGLAETELPGHTKQLLAFLPDGARTHAAT